LKRPGEPFDAQADDFDKRSGLGAAVGHDVAKAILDLTSLSSDDAVLEIGAGTGEIGRHLAAMPSRYLGLDLSSRMLRVFQRKLGIVSNRVLLAQADCDRPWPVPDRSITVVVASRVAHLLSANRVADEVTRVCRVGGYCLVGRVERDGRSIKSRLRRQRQVMLAECGITARAGSQGSHRVIDALAARGATALGTETVSSWTGTTTADDVISSWEAIPARVDVELSVRARVAVLRGLRDWARRELGDLHQPEEFVERYAIAVVRVQ
jgi:ubiquinone/menaquinone biosynthesis C-methylase UbiE